MRRHVLVLSFTDDEHGNFTDVEMADHSEKFAEPPELISFLRFLASEMEGGHASRREVELS